MFNARIRQREKKARVKAHQGSLSTIYKLLFLWSCHRIEFEKSGAEKFLPISIIQRPKEYWESSKV